MTYGDDSPQLTKIGDALSQLGNVAILSIFWGHTNTSANESISGRCYRQDRWLKHFIDLLFFWQQNPEHCERAYWADVVRARRYLEANEKRNNS